MTGRFAIPGTGGYMDALGRRWGDMLLADLLDDPAVRTAVDEVYREAHVRGRFQASRCYVAARQRYAREEAAALLHVLVAAHCDQMGKPWPDARGPR